MESFIITLACAHPSGLGSTGASPGNTRKSSICSNFVMNRNECLNDIWGGWRTSKTIMGQIDTFSSCYQLELEMIGRANDVGGRVSVAIRPVSTQRLIKFWAGGCVL